MGRVKKSRGRREQQLPELSWTPLRHKCGCVIDWGWDGRTSDPVSFITHCLAVLPENCPWHGGETGIGTSVPVDATLDIQDSGVSTGFFARYAGTRDYALAEELVRQAAELQRAVKEGRVLSGIPEEYLDHMISQGHDPEEAWLHERLVDIFLNRGRQTVNEVYLARLPGMQ